MMIMGPPQRGKGSGSVRASSALAVSSAPCGGTRPSSARARARFPASQPASTPPENCANPKSKSTIVTADSRVNPSDPAAVPARPVREVPSTMPTGLLDGPGRNWLGATRSAIAALVAPAAPVDILVAVFAEIGDPPAERSEAQHQEHGEDLGRRASPHGEHRHFHRHSRPQASGTLGACDPSQRAMTGHVSRAPRSGFTMLHAMVAPAK